MKIRSEWAESFHMRTDGQDEANSPFRTSANAPKKTDCNDVQGHRKRWAGFETAIT